MPVRRMERTFPNPKSEESSARKITCNGSRLTVRHSCTRFRTARLRPSVKNRVNQTPPYLELGWVAKGTAAPTEQCSQKCVKSNFADLLQPACLVTMKNEMAKQQSSVF
jgi:hypothetical protein